MPAKAKKFPPAYSAKKFEKEIVLLPYIVADTVIWQRQQEQKTELTEAQHKWFCDFADWRVRWFYKNDDDWNAELKRDDPRDFVYGWIGHWADAFFKEGPDAYIAKKRQESVDSPDAEWKPGGILA